MNNQETVKKWRHAGGNDMRQRKYHYIRSFKVESKQADKLKYQSIPNIVKFLYLGGYIDDTLKSNNELFELVNG